MRECLDQNVQQRVAAAHTSKHWLPRDLGPSSSFYFLNQKSKSENRKPTELKVELPNLKQWESEFNSWWQNSKYAKIAHACPHFS